MITQLLFMLEGTEGDDCSWKPVSLSPQFLQVQSIQSLSRTNERNESDRHIIFHHVYRMAHSACASLLSLCSSRASFCTWGLVLNKVHDAAVSPKSRDSRIAATYLYVIILSETESVPTVCRVRRGKRGNIHHRSLIFANCSLLPITNTSLQLVGELDQKTFAGVLRGFGCHRPCQHFF